jgi:hypothetical protein
LKHDTEFRSGRLGRGHALKDVIILGEPNVVHDQLRWTLIEEASR